MNEVKKTERPSGLYRVGIFVANTLFRLLFGVKVIEGSDCLPESGAAIIACNHISALDPVFLCAGQKRQITYMAKAELFKNKFIGWVCRSFGAFPVERGSADLHSVNTAFDLLNNGHVLGIFPEGTRSKDGEIGKGKVGVAMIALRSGAPVYPVGVYCRGGVHLFCKYIIAFGEPVTAEQLGMKEGTSAEYRAATRQLMEIISGLRDKCMEAAK